MRLKRNEVYARYGRAFKSADLQAHFQASSWYMVVETYTDSQLTETDKANIALIRSFEAPPEPRDGMVGELMFINTEALVITDGSSMYGDDGGERHYVSRGTTYVVTWSGSAGFGTSSEDLELWTWTGSTWTRQPVSPPAG
jgi:hypothetical protein